MATVDGVTVAEADRIEKKHISALAVVDGDLVLTRENLATISTPLPEAGSFTPQAVQMVAGDMTSGRTFHSSGVINLNTSSLVPDSWTPQPFTGVTPVEFTSTPGEYGWTFDEAGWYMLDIAVTARFTAAAVDPHPLPDGLRVVLQTWLGFAIDHSFPVLKAHRDGTAGTAKDVLGNVKIGPYYSPGTAVETNEQTAHQLFLRWNGNAVISDPGGGADPGIIITATKVA